MPSAEFEPTIPASKRPQTQALDRAATRIGLFVYYIISTYFSQDTLQNEAGYKPGLLAVDLNAIKANIFGRKTARVHFFL
jgi:hypothetical protein